MAEGRARRGADLRPEGRAVLRGLRRRDLRTPRAGRRGPLPRARSAQGVHRATDARPSSAPRPARRSSRPTRSSKRSARDYSIPRVRRGDVRARRRWCAASSASTAARRRRRPCSLDEAGNLLTKQYQLSKGNPIADTKELLAKIKAFVHDQGATLEVLGFGATGYAADVLEESLRADVNIVETVAHMTAAVKYFGDVDVICDIGGQDIKVLFMVNGEIRNFRLSNQCSAGNGMLLQAMANQFGLPVTEYADAAFKAPLSPKFSYGCAVFLDADRVNFQKEGYSKEELLAGLAMVLPKNVWQYVVQIPRLAQLGTRYVLQGGTQYNLAAVKAQVDYIKERVPGASVHRPSASGRGRRHRRRRWKRCASCSGAERRRSSVSTPRSTSASRRVNDESTTCHFCPNHCSRTFIDTKTPDGRTSRYISGFSCEKGTVESIDALRVLEEQAEEPEDQLSRTSSTTRRGWRSATSTRRSRFRRRARVIDDVDVQKDAARRGPEDAGPPARSSGRRRCGRAPAEDPHRHPARAQPVLLRAGLADLLRDAWLRRAPTSSSATRRRRRCGPRARGTGRSIPCYPSKVAQAHIHNLIFKKHAKTEARLHLLPVHHAHADVRRRHAGLDELPDRRRRAEGHAGGVHQGSRFLRARRASSMSTTRSRSTSRTISRGRCSRRGARGSASPRTRTTTPAAKASRRCASSTRRWSAAASSCSRSSKRRTRSACCCSGGPYHLDPGLHHGVPDEYQALGYPILSIRSIPKDPKWLARFFKDDLERGFVDDAAVGAGRVAGELLHQQRAEGLGGQVRRAASERRRARSLELQVRPRCADLRPDRQHHQLERHAGVGAARHRRQQARRLDQDPRQDLRPHAQAVRGGARRRRGAARPSCSGASRTSGASCCRRGARRLRETAHGRSPRPAGARRARSRLPRPTWKKTPRACRMSPKRIQRGSTSRRRRRRQAMVFHRTHPTETSHERSPAGLRRDRARAARLRGRGAPRLGLEEEPVEHWHDPNPQTFTRAERDDDDHPPRRPDARARHAADRRARRARLHSSRRSTVPTSRRCASARSSATAASAIPTYFTVGNLVKHLIHLRDQRGHARPRRSSGRYVFLTAGACGPCRFGTYVTEYRKALRDSGFEGFRVLLFQQQGGLKQATGEAAGLEINARFFKAALQAVDGGRLPQPRRLPHPALRGATRATPTRRSRSARRSSRETLRAARKRGRRAACDAAGGSIAGRR